MDCLHLDNHQLFLIKNNGEGRNHIEDSLVRLVHHSSAIENHAMTLRSSKSVNRF